MSHFKLKAYGADRVVIGVRNRNLNKKIFQINFKSKDGSLFVSVPYAKLGMGRLGVVECPPGNPESLLFGESAPVTAHSVKYTHHPDGEAHFSLDGKVLTQVRRRGVPLTAAEGHLFTLMVQGLHHFEDFSQNDIPSSKRGIVPMPMPEGQIEALKFVGLLYSAKDFASRLLMPMDSPWIPIQQPDGSRLAGIALATRLVNENHQYILVVSVEQIKTISTHTDLFVSFLGGFDPPNIALDHISPTGFLMMIYPEQGDIASIIEDVGTIDILK